MIPDVKNMTRQQRRQLIRKQKKLQQRTHFTREDIEKVTGASYEAGKNVALEAAKNVLGLGTVRLNRIKKELIKLENKKFVHPFEDLRKEAEKLKNN